MSSTVPARRQLSEKVGGGLFLTDGFKRSSCTTRVLEACARVAPCHNADRGHETGSQQRQKESRHGAPSRDSTVYVKTRTPQLCRWILVASLVVVVSALLRCRSLSRLFFFFLCSADWSERKLFLFAFQLSPYFGFVRGITKPLTTAVLNIHLGALNERRVLPRGETPGRGAGG